MEGAFAVDTRKEAFRQLVERAGITDAVTRALVMLYEEPTKPEDPLLYFRNALASMADDRQAALEAEVAKLREENETLRGRLEELEAARASEAPAE